jgi:hypothetical protein
MSLYRAAGVTAWVVLMQHADGDARLGTDPVAAQIPLPHDTVVLVLGSRTVLLTYTCTGNVAFPARLLVTLCSWLGSQTHWLLLNSFHVAVSEKHAKYKSEALLLLLLLLIFWSYCPFQALSATTMLLHCFLQLASVRRRVWGFPVSVFTFSSLSLVIYFKGIVSLGTCLNPQPWRQGYLFLCGRLLKPCLAWLVPPAATPPLAQILSSLIHISPLTRQNIYLQQGGDTGARNITVWVILYNMEEFYG